MQTLDFLTPVVDEPYIFGQIAAANSLSDVYAMGGRPVTVMNIVCFPSEKYNKDILKDVLAGGNNKIEDSGAVLVGGHSVEDNEFKYGLSVTGLVHPDKYISNSGSRKKDSLILTKALGTGIVSTALKAGLADKKTVSEMIENMTALNDYILDLIENFNINGLTDITGFGLAGHLMEMAKGAKKRFIIYTEKLPLLKNIENFASMGLIPAGAYRNRDYCSKNVLLGKGLQRYLTDIIFDPQTSGGLVISTPSSMSKAVADKIESMGIRAEIIGEAAEDNEKGIVEFV